MSESPPSSPEIEFASSVSVVDPIRSKRRLLSTFSRGAAEIAEEIATENEDGRR